MFSSEIALTVPLVDSLIVGMGGEYRFSRSDMRRGSSLVSIDVTGIDEVGRGESKGGIEVREHMGLLEAVEMTGSNNQCPTHCTYAFRHYSIH